MSPARRPTPRRPTVWILAWVLSVVGCTSTSSPPDAASLPADLAERLVDLLQDSAFGPDGELDPAELERARRWLRAFQPGTELYLLDSRGALLFYGAELGAPSFEAVPMAGIRRQLDRRPRLRRGAHGPTEAGEPSSEADGRGVDPHHGTKEVPFATAVMPRDDGSTAFLYVIARAPALAAQPVEEVLPKMPRQPVWGILSALVALVLIAAFRADVGLRRLAAAMDALEPDGPPRSGGARPRSGLGHLRRRFAAMELRVQARLEGARHLDQMRRELFTNLSHDLRTPVATLRGYLETLSLGDSALTVDQRKEYLAIALKHAERLGRLVNELLELAKLDGGRVAPAWERLPMGELVQDNVQRFMLRARSLSIDLRAELDPEPTPVFADVALMERALENLIENALGHTEPGGRVTVSLRHDDGRVIVRIEDTGCGISPEDLPHVFERFYRAKTGRRREGAGLGLAVTRRIVELHRSELTVESRVGEGTVFAFALAVAPPTRARTLTTRLSRHLRSRGRSGDREPGRETPTGDAVYR